MSLYAGSTQFAFWFYSSLRRYLETFGQCKTERLECFEIGLNTFILPLDMAKRVWGPVNLEGWAWVWTLGPQLAGCLGRLWNVLEVRGVRGEVSRWAWVFKVVFHFLLFLLSLHFCVWMTMWADSCPCHHAAQPIATPFLPQWTLSLCNHELK